MTFDKIFSTSLTTLHATYGITMATWHRLIYFRRLGNSSCRSSIRLWRHPRAAKCHPVTSRSHVTQRLCTSSLTCDITSFYINLLYQLHVGLNDMFNIIILRGLVVSSSDYQTCARLMYRHFVARCQNVREGTWHFYCVV